LEKKGSPRKVERLLVTKGEAGQTGRSALHYAGCAATCALAQPGCYVSTVRWLPSTASWMAGSCCVARTRSRVSRTSLGYQQLLQVEPGWWGPDDPIWSCARDLPPRLEQRIRAHVPLLAGRAAGALHRDRTGRTWAAVREDLTGPAGTFIPTSKPTDAPKRSWPR
jgi:hypothetical protein